MVKDIFKYNLHNLRFYLIADKLIPTEKKSSLNLNLFQKCFKSKSFL